jgi:hypothetical protein
MCHDEDPVEGLPLVQETSQAAMERGKVLGRKLDRAEGLNITGDALILVVPAVTRFTLVINIEAHGHASSSKRRGSLAERLHISTS